ncbi:MAG: hypothetical protein V9E89_16030 [Ilumatobacteraceae bacterium]
MNPAAWVERHGHRRPGEPALADGERVHATWAAVRGADRRRRRAACVTSSGCDPVIEWRS